MKTDFFVYTDRSGKHILDKKKIVRFQADGPCTSVFYDGKVRCISSNLGCIEKRLDGDHRFLKTERSHIININMIEAYINDNGGHILLKDNSMVPLSRRRKKSFFSSLISFSTVG